MRAPLIPTNGVNPIRMKAQAPKKTPWHGLRALSRQHQSITRKNMGDGFIMKFEREAGLEIIGRPNHANTSPCSRVDKNFTCGQCSMVICRLYRLGAR